MSEAVTMTHAEKWARVEALRARLTELDRAWEQGVEELNELLAVRVPKPERVNIRRRTPEAATAFAIQVRSLAVQGLTQREIANRTGTSREAVNYYLKPICKAALRAVTP